MKGFYKSGLSGQDLQVIGFDKHEINSLLKNLDTFFIEQNLYVTEANAIADTILDLFEFHRWQT